MCKDLATSLNVAALVIVATIWNNLNVQWGLQYNELYSHEKSYCRIILPEMEKCWDTILS